MGIRVSIENDSAETPWGQLPAVLRTIYSKHIAKLACVRVLRTHRGPGSGPLGHRLEIDTTDGMGAEEMVEDLVRETIRIIGTDACKPRGRNTPKAGTVGSWHGEVVLYSDADGSRSIAKIPVELEEPSADLDTRRELEELSILAHVKGFMAMSFEQMVKIIGAAAAREEAMAGLVASVAKSTGKSNRKLAKYKFKARKVEAETRRHEADARTRSARHRAWADAFETAAEEYRDVVAIWSKYFTRERAGGKPPPAPQRPTADELRTVFADERLQRVVTVRLGDTSQETSPEKVIAEMVAEPDPRRRMHLAKLLAATVRAWPEDLQQLLKVSMVTALGMERCEEIAAWLSLPIT